MGEATGLDRDGMGFLRYTWAGPHNATPDSARKDTRGDELRCESLTPKIGFCE